jgi:PadR family transcriptional regulator AphA
LHTNYGARVPDLSLTDWVVLGVIAEAPTHGFAVARELAPEGALGQVWTVPRPLVYRAISSLAEKELVEECGTSEGERGPVRTMVRVTRRGRTALNRWLDQSVIHLRDVRTVFLCKLALLERSGRSPAALIRNQRAELQPIFAAIERAPKGDGFDLTLQQWRREQARAIKRFLDTLAK